MQRTFRPNHSSLNFKLIMQSRIRSTPRLLRCVNRIGKEVRRCHRGPLSQNNTEPMLRRLRRSNSGVSPATRLVDPAEIALLFKRGKDLIANGDLAAARVVLHRAADLNDAEAALALGATYDPYVLRELKVYGLAADPVMARTWYEKAKELGSAAASRRLELLSR